MLITKEKLIIK